MNDSRCLFVCGALLLWFVNGLYADGAYQRTKDDKTIVWNPDLRHEDAAGWSGERDKRHYATGYGTLTWYRVERKFSPGLRVPFEKYIPVIRYSGKMVRGKLDGPVVAVDAEGKTSHATFADGIINGEWAAAPVPKPEHPPLQNSGATGPSDEPDSGRDESVQRGAVAKAPAEEPSPAASPTPDQQRGDETVRRDVVVDVPAEGPSAAASPARSPTPDQRADQHVAQQPTMPVPAEGPLAGASPSPAVASSPVTDRSADPRVAVRSTRATRGRASDLLQSLALPPSVLGPRMNLLAGTSPQPSAASTSPSAPAGPRLSPAEVIGLADAEAHTQGYDVGGYERPKVNYTGANDTWSVVYDQKPVNATAEAGKHFTVTVDDKTKKPSVVTGK